MELVSGSLVVLALLCFVADAFRVPFAPDLRLTPLGLALLTFAFIILGWQ